MAEDKMVLVRNRNVGVTGYTLENGFQRRFEIGEEKRVPLEELRQLSFSSGGEYILKHCLVIEDQSALDYLNMEVEPEYFYSEDDIKKVLFEGTLDQLEDTLNFAPQGAIEILKKMAVELEVPDTRKRDMISEKTGFDVNGAINVNHILAAGEEEEETAAAQPKRKAAPITESKTAGTTQRKAAPVESSKPAPPPKNKYTIVG